MAKLIGTDLEKFQQLCNKTYKEQAVWFLNAFWDTRQGEAERFWNYINYIVTLDIDKHGEGSAVDELKAHVFLEHFKETLTVQAMRSKLREVGAIGPQERPKLVPLTHYLVFRFGVDWHVLVNAAQGDNQKEIDEAQRRMDEVAAAFAETERKNQAATAALREAEANERAAVKAEAEAKAREAEAKSTAEKAAATKADAIQKEAEAKTAKDELELALAEVKAQEDAYNQKTAELKRKTQEGGLVAQNRAKNELAQHLSEDPLPLRRAKITQEAAVKKAEKTAKASEEARVRAEEAHVKAIEAAQQAEQARADSEAAAQLAKEARDAAEVAKNEADLALEQARERVQEAEAYLEEVKSRPGCAHGAIWWMQRELEEKKKYLPERKGGVKKQV